MADILTLPPAFRPPKKQNLHTLLLKHCIDTATLAGQPAALWLVRDILRSAPASREQLADDAWAADSMCWLCLRTAEVRAQEGKIADADFERLLQFWTQAFAGQEPGLRSTVLAMLDLLVEASGADGAMPAAAAPVTRAGPDWLGYVVSLALPTPPYPCEPGHLGQKPDGPAAKK